MSRASGESNEDNTNHKRRRQRRRPISKRCVTTSRNQSSARNVSGTTDACVLAVKAEGRRRPLLRMVMTMTIAAVDALAAGTCVATRATGPV